MEEGLSAQTKISLIKNEREERSLLARLEKINMDKSVWAHNSECNMKLFMKTHSRLMSRALGTSQLADKGQNSPHPKHFKMCRKKKILDFPKLSFTSLINNDFPPEANVGHGDVTDRLITDEQNHSENSNHINDVIGEKDEATTESTEAQTLGVVHEEKDLIETPNDILNAPKIADGLADIAEGTERQLAKQENTVPAGGNITETFEGLQDTPVKNKFENETPLKIAPGQTFITELSLIEEENVNLLSPESEKESSEKALPLIRPAPNTQFVRKRSLVKPTLSPITDKSEDTDRTQLNHLDDMLSDKETPQDNGEVSPEEDFSREASEENEVDSEDGCIEQVRISNDMSNNNTDENGADLQQMISDDNGETTPVTNLTIDVPKAVDGTTPKLATKQLKKKHRKASVSKPKANKSFLTRLSPQSQGLLSPQPFVPIKPRMLYKPICRRYEEAMVPSAFNIDFIKRIIKKNTVNDSDDDDDDQVKRKPQRRRSVMSPIKPRVIWTQEKLASLPDCRYLRFPPLVQIGQAF